MHELGQGVIALIPPRLWIALGFAVLLTVIGGQQVRISNAKATTAGVRVDLANLKATAAESARFLDQSYRAEEARRETSKQTEIDRAHTQTAAAQAAAVVADATAGQLRNQLAAYVTAVRRATTDTSPASGGAGQRGADPLDLLAELYGGADQAAGEIAQYAGRLGIAGAACERIADGFWSGG